MALTLSPVSGASFVISNKKCRVYTVTFDSSYPDDGESLTAADVKLKVIEQAIVHGPFIDAGNDNGVPVVYDYGESKLVALWDNESGSNSSLIDVDDTTDLSAYSGRITFIGF